MGTRFKTLVFPNSGSSSHINNNYCSDPTCVKALTSRLDPVVNPEPDLVVSSQVVNHSLSKTVCTSKNMLRKTVNMDVFCHVVNHAHFASFMGHPQKKGLSPDPMLKEIKHVKGVSCVNLCLSAPFIHNVVKEMGAGSRLQKFWQGWHKLGANPRVVSILKEGYTLLF